MDEGWPEWAQDAWRSLSPAQRKRAQRVWTTIARGFGGVLVGPGPLVRHLVDDAEMGHRSTLETLGVLVERDLLEARRAAEATVLWVPSDLMPEETSERNGPRRPRFLSTPRANGSRQAAWAEA